MHLSNTMTMLPLANNFIKQYSTLNINDLGKGIAQQIIHSTYFDFTQYRYFECTQHKYLQINISDAFAKCLNVLLKLPKACVHVRTHGKTVCLANLFVG